MRGSLFALGISSLLACAPAVTRPVRVLSPQALGEVAPAERFGASDQGASAQELRQRVEARFSASASALLRYEPALEGVARVVGQTWSETGQPPAHNLLWWLHWRAGVPGAPAGFWTSSLQGGAGAGRLDARLAEWGRALAAQVREPRAWAVVRFSAWNGDEVQALVVADDTVELNLPRAVKAGAPLEVKGRLRVPADKLTLSLEDDEARVRQVTVALDAEGRFEATLPAPQRPGRRFLDLVMLPPPEPGALAWSRPVALVPLLVDTPEPTAVDQPISKPRPNPADVASWPAKVTESWNARRRALGLAAMTSEPALASLAQRYADQHLAAPATPPDPDLVQRVNSAGVVSRDVAQHVAEAEYLDELTWLAWARPSRRLALLSAEPPVHGVGVAQGADGRFQFSEVVAQPVGKLDLAAETQALHARFAALRAVTGLPELQRDAGLDAAVLEAARKTCREGGALDKAVLGDGLARANLNGASTWVSGSSAHLLPVDLALFVGALTRKPGTHVAIATCQHEAGKERGRQFVVVFLLDAAARR